MSQVDKERETENTQWPMFRAHTYINNNTMTTMVLNKSLIVNGRGGGGTDATSLR